MILRRICAVPRPRPLRRRRLLPLLLDPIIPTTPLQGDIRALGPPETQRCRHRPVWFGRRLGSPAGRFVRYRKSISDLSVRPCNPLILTPIGFDITQKKHRFVLRTGPDSDIGVRRKAAFLLNSLLTPAVAIAAASTGTNSSVSPGVGAHGGESQSPASVHPNSHASMVADPASVDTAPETLRALRTHGLLPVLVRELTEPTPYGPDGDEGDGRDADLEEKLTRFRIKTPTFDSFQNKSVFY